MKIPNEELAAFRKETQRAGARSLILFGSRPKDEHTEESDVDLCLISNNLPQDTFKRRYLAPSGYGWLSVFGFYPDEFLSMLREANLFALDIVYYGKSLHDDGFLSEAQEVFDQTQTVRAYGLRRNKRGWEWKV